MCIAHSYHWLFVATALIMGTGTFADDVVIKTFAGRWTWPAYYTEAEVKRFARNQYPPREAHEYAARSGSTILSWNITEVKTRRKLGGHNDLWWGRPWFEVKFSRQIEVEEEKHENDGSEAEPDVLDRLLAVYTPNHIPSGAWTPEDAKRIADSVAEEASAALFSSIHDVGRDSSFDPDQLERGFLRTHSTLVEEFGQTLVKDLGVGVDPAERMFTEALATAIAGRQGASPTSRTWGTPHDSLADRINAASSVANAIETKPSIRGDLTDQVSDMIARASQHPTQQRPNPARDFWTKPEQTILRLAKGASAHLTLSRQRNRIGREMFTIRNNRDQQPSAPSRASLSEAPEPARRPIMLHTEAQLLMGATRVVIYVTDVTWNVSPGDTSRDAWILVGRAAKRYDKLIVYGYADEPTTYPSVPGMTRFSGVPSGLLRKLNHKITYSKTYYGREKLEEMMESDYYDDYDWHRFEPTSR